MILTTEEVEELFKVWLYRLPLEKRKSFDTNTLEFIFKSNLYKLKDKSQQALKLRLLENMDNEAIAEELSTNYMSASQTYLRAMQKLNDFSTKIEHIKALVSNIDVLFENLVSVFDMPKFLITDINSKESTQKKEILKENLFLLKPKEQEVIYLRYIENIKPGEVAKLTSIDCHTSSHLHAKSIKKLKQNLISN
jgi:DNA-directed RNA polymerase specialized sigma subunit